jgi:F-type H+-transporting ATPase subunit delta
MRQTKVAQRYAKALFDLALETGKVEEVKNDLDTINGVKHPELQILLVSPVITGEKKTSVFDAVFASHIQPLTTSFFKLVFTKGRSVAIKEIIAAFMNMYRIHKGIQVVELTTAIPLSEETRNAVKAILQQNVMLLNKTIELSEHVDASLIGGMVVQVDDKLFDASIRHDLQFIKRQFVKNMYVQEIR